MNSAAGDSYVIVRNHEEQYSIWRADRAVPAGWEAVGAAASREECLARIEELWTDLRPLSLRVAMAESEDRRRLAESRRTSGATELLG